MLLFRRSLVLLLLAVMSAAQLSAQQRFAPPSGKEIYIPNDLKENDFTQKESKWSYARMAYTDDVVVFWEKAFGDDLSQAPDLDGQNMKVDLDNLLNRLQSFYDFYKKQLKFILPGSKADKYRMMVMLNYTLEGTAYGGDYDGQIGALWISPNRVQDKKLNCIAHELGHSFQSQVGCDGEGVSWGGGGIFEMTSQWMLWQVNPQWTTDENYHWQGFIEHHNLRFLAGENIYHSPYVLEYWAMKHGITVMGDLFRAGKRGEDPAMTYMRVFGLTIDQMNSQMLDCYSRLITFDFPRVKESHRRFVGEMTTPMAEPQQLGKAIVLQPREEMIPETWGFNVVDLSAATSKKKATIQFEGLNQDANATYQVGVVNVKNGEATYGPVISGSKFKMKVPAMQDGTTYLVVVGCPKTEYKVQSFNQRRHGSKPEVEAKFPYRITIK
ncbi:MAG: hypothetical protein KBT39_03125 [Bacteroidales bacterium]|nr:hypothetical protein [Bacteroidales bacterium]